MAEAAGSSKTFKPIGELTSHDYYHDWPAHPEIQKQILCDKVFLNAYRRAILENEQLFKDKIILDIGCGTALFSMWAAKAGARRVFGVDSSSFAQVAEKIVKKNGLDDVVTIIQGKVDQIHLPVDKVDVIISNWVGKSLFSGSRIKSVIYARDKWLIPNGAILPDQVTLYITGIEDFSQKTDKLDFWDNVFGFKMTSMKQAAATTPVNATFAVNTVATSHDPLLIFDMNSMTQESLNMRLPFRLEARRPKKVTALMTWFTIQFSKCQQPISVATSPHLSPTHWKQTAFYLQKYDQIEMKQPGDEIIGFFQINGNRENKDTPNFEIDLTFKDYSEQTSYWM